MDLKLDEFLLFSFILLFHKFFEIFLFLFENLLLYHLELKNIYFGFLSLSSYNVSTLKFPCHLLSFSLFDDNLIWMKSTFISLSILFDYFCVPHSFFVYLLSKNFSVWFTFLSLTSSIICSQWLQNILFRAYE